MTSSPSAAVLRGHAAASVTAYQQNVLVAGADGAREPVGAQKPQVRLDDVYAEEIRRLREQAAAEGYAAGHAAGMAAAEQAVAQVQAEAAERLVAIHAAQEQQVASAIAALTAAADRLDAKSAPALDDLTSVIAEGAYALVVALLGRELAACDTATQDATRRALALTGTDAPVVVRVHPEDHAALRPEWLAGLPATVALVPDPSVERGGAVAQAGTRRVDAQVSTALERVRTVLHA